MAVKFAGVFLISKSYFARRTSAAAAGNIATPLHPCLSTTVPNDTAEMTAGVSAISPSLEFYVAHETSRTQFSCVETGGIGQIVC
ncbi:hypothetical protein [Mesorhizobium sp. STM 4661]|uniref:hypothetical protein n=1 Tax=Mesorhizobium sp. STM 4661 TaxID=1297570 RepID=UPI000568ACEC|nr:hypothetical protein [Mesorhizobium sp. STM 4661]